jgi:hypothetical protein
MEPSEEIRYEENFAQFTKMLMALGEYYHRGISPWWWIFTGKPYGAIR